MTTLRGMAMSGCAGSKLVSRSGPRGLSTAQHPGFAGSAAACFLAYQSVVHSQTLPQTS